MLRKMMLAAGAVAAIGLLAPDEAFARGGFRGGGGYHGAGGFRAAGIGMGGAGFRAASVSGAFRAAAIAPGLRGGTFAGNAWRAGYHPGYRPFRRFPVAAAAAVVGAGVAYGAYPYGYGYYDDYYARPYYANYPYDYDGNLIYNGGYYGNGCTVVRQRFPTPYGWVLRPVQVCD
jgi:hypothetical protein